MLQRPQTLFDLGQKAPAAHAAASQLPQAPPLIQHGLRAADFLVTVCAGQTALQAIAVCLPLSDETTKE
jgi:hypothetical protein